MTLSFFPGLRQRLCYVQPNNPFVKIKLLIDRDDLPNKTQTEWSSVAGFNLGKL